MSKAKSSQPRRQKHMPQRMCVVCRERFEKRSLIRIVHNPETGLQVDETGKMNGRGAYLCQQSSCWDKALRSNTLDLALKVEISAAHKAALEQFKSTKIGD